MISILIAFASVHEWNVGIPCRCLCLIKFVKPFLELLTHPLHFRMRATVIISNHIPLGTWNRGNFKYWLQQMFDLCGAVACSSHTMPHFLDQNNPTFILNHLDSHCLNLPCTTTTLIICNCSWSNRRNWVWITGGLEFGAACRQMPAAAGVAAWLEPVVEK